jgi:hypothetical protein
MGEVTLDEVFYRAAKGPRRAKSYRAEVEGDHLEIGRGHEQSAWKGPHRLRDTRRKAFVKSPGADRVRWLSEVFTGYLGLIPAKEGKYAEGRRLLGIDSAGDDHGQKRSQTW